MKIECYTPVPLSELHPHVISITHKETNRKRLIFLRIVTYFTFILLGIIFFFPDKTSIGFLPGDASGSGSKNMNHGFFRGRWGSSSSKQFDDKIQPTKLSGGGRDWTLNLAEKTISPKHNDMFVLGSHPYTPLVLTNEGDSNAITFPKEQLEALKEGKSVSLTGLGLQYPNGDMKEFDGWAYTEAAGTTSEDDSLAVRYTDDNFIVCEDKEGHDIVLDVSFWKNVKGNTVNFVRSLHHDDNDDGSKKNTWWDRLFKKKTFLYGGGRDWIINVDDGTIRPKHAPYLVLGSGPKRLILTTKGSPAELKFDKLDMLARGERVPLTFESSNGGIGKMYEDERFLGPWRYIESEIVDHSDAIQMTYVDNNYIATAETGIDEEKALVLDVSYWFMSSGNTVNLVGGWTYE